MWKKGTRIVAILLALIMSMQPSAEYISKAQENMTGQVTVTLEQAFRPSDGRGTGVYCQEGMLDLTDFKPNEIAEMVWQFGIRADNVSDAGVQDSQSFTIPKDYWIIEDTGEAQPVLAEQLPDGGEEPGPGKVIGSYTIKDQTVTVTVETEGMESGVVYGTMELLLRWSESCSQREGSEQTILPFELASDNSYAIKLPSWESAGASEGGQDLGQPEEGQEADAQPEEGQEESQPGNGQEEEQDPGEDQGEEIQPGEDQGEEIQPGEDQEEEQDPGEDQGEEIQPEEGKPGNDQGDDMLPEGGQESEDQPENGQEEGGPEGDNNQQNVVDKEKVRALFSTFSFVRGVAKSAGDSYFDGGTVSRKVLSGAYLPDGFGTVRLTAVSREAGYSSNDTDDLFVRMSFDMNMDEDYLYLKSEEFMEKPSFPQQGGKSDEEWMQDIGVWLGSQTDEDVPPLEYTFELGDYFANCNIAKTNLSGADGTMIGSYEITNGNLKVIMNKQLYFMNSISFEFSFDAQIDKGKLKPDKEEVVVGDKGKLVFQQLGTLQGGAGGAQKPKYKVEKEAPLKVADTSIIYTIKATALDSNNLNGMILVDAMPQSGGFGLKAKSFVQVSQNGTAMNKELPLNTATDASGNIHYSFEALNNTGSNKITSAEFALTLELNDASLQNMINSGKIDEMFSNKAALQKAGESAPQAESDEVRTQMKVNFIGKKGKVSNLEGTRYEWNIELNTMLPYMKNGYLLDTLCWTDHTYNFTKGISVSYDGKTDTFTGITKYEGTQEEWKNLTVAQLNAMSGGSEPGKGQPFYYIYDEAEENPYYVAGKGSTPNRQRAILVIPYNKYAGTTSGKQVAVKYFTDLNMNGLTSKEYLDQQKKYEAAHPGTVFSVKNDVNLLWENKAGGVGPTPVDQEFVNFGKEVVTGVDAVSKQGVSYDEKKQTAVWAIDVNKLGVDMTEVVLTDTVDGSKFDISNMKIEYYKYNTKDQSKSQLTAFPKLGATPGNLNTAFGYTLDQSTGEIKMYLGDLPTDQATNSHIHYKLMITARLTDETILSEKTENTANVEKISNSVSLEAEHGPDIYTDSSSADIETPNTLIEKEAVGTYDYYNGMLHWKVTINPGQVPLNNVSVVDKLDSGFKYTDLEKVEVNGVENPAELGTIKASASPVNTGTSADGLEEWEVTWTLGNIGINTYTLYFTSTATPKWRHNKLEAHTDSNGQMTEPTVDVPNLVTLKGNLQGGTPIGNSAYAEAVHEVKKEPVSKKGVMVKDSNGPTGEIRWTVILNQGRRNLNGLYAEEILEEGGIHELDPDTIKIETLDGSGNYQVVPGAEPSQAANAEGTVPWSDGFRYTYPNADDYNTYRITFSSWLTENAQDANAGIRNQVYLKDSGGNVQETSKPDDGGFHGGFDFANAAKASTRPKVALRKVSSNSVNVDDPLQSHGLSATFALNGYEIDTYDPTTKTLTLASAFPKYDKTRAVEEGDGLFLNINPSDSIVYMLSETHANAGYNEGTSKPAFLYIVKNVSGKIITGDVEKVVMPDHTEHQKDDNVKFFNAFEPDAQNRYPTDLKALTILFTNEPHHNTVTITKNKIDTASYAFDGTTETINYAPETGVVFKVEPLNDLAGKVNTIYTTPSGADGRITLSDLDPGTYRMTEIKAETGYVTGATVQLKVTVDTLKPASDPNYYKFEFLVDQNGEKGITIDNPNLTLQDDFLRGSFGFTKYVQYHNEDGSEKEGTEILSGVDFVLKGTTRGGTADNYTQKAKSDAKGQVSFSNLPLGSYTVYEDGASVPGYTEGTAAAPGTAVYTVNVTEDQDTTTTWTDGSTVYTKTVAKTEVQNLRTEDTKKEIYNTPITGSLTFQKQVEEDVLTGLNNTGIEGAEFGLYRVRQIVNGNQVENKTSSSPTYTAVSQAGGTVEFSGVEYGNYVLKETTVPDGYGGSTDSVISKDMLKAVFSPADKPISFAYSHGDKVSNTIIKTDVPFLKKDVDKNPMPDIKFSVYRRNSVSIGADGTNLEMDAKNAVKFYAYLPLNTGTPESGTITSGADGTFMLAGLPCGDYLLVEDDVPDLQAGYSKVAVAVSIGRKDGETVVTVKENQDFGGTLHTAGADEYYDNPLSPAEEWETLNKENGKPYLILNYKQYGYVQLNKIAAERVNGVIQSDKGEPLAGARFEIQKLANPNDPDSGVRYLTLLTNESGQFTCETSGENAGVYRDMDGLSEDAPADDTSVYKHLFPGTYTIKEIEAPAGITFDAANAPIGTFNIGADTGHEGTAWISDDNGDSTKFNTTYVKAGDTSKDTSVLYVENEVTYNELVLVKTDNLDVNIKLGGAQFLVYPGGKQKSVASLQSTGVPGEYRLSNKNPEGGTFSDEQKRPPYLAEEGGVYRLLPGQYDIVEYQAPKGYICQKEKITIALLNDGTLELKQNTTDQAASLSPDKSMLQMTNQKTAFYLDKISNEKDAGGSTVRVNGAGLEIRTAAGTAVSGMTWTSDGADHGTITGLPAGDYQLVEINVPAGYAKADTIYFTLNEDNSITLKEDSPGEVKKESDGNYIIFMTDEVVRANVTLKKLRVKTDGVKEILPGVVFDLYEQTGANPDAANDTKLKSNLVTGTAGTLYVSGLPQGNYYFLETKTAENSYLDPAKNTWRFSVTPQQHKKTINLTAENAALNVQVSVPKVDGASGQHIPGTTFTLSKKEGNDWVRQADAVTGADGTARFYPESEGQYRVQETKAAPGYILSQTNPYTAELQITQYAHGKQLVLQQSIPADIQTIFAPAITNDDYKNGKLSNQRMQGSVSLKKEDEKDSTALDGVTFGLFEKQGDASAKKVGEFVTGNAYELQSDGSFTSKSAKAGTLRIDGLGWGSYYIQEIAALEGYVLSNSQHEFTIGQYNLEVRLGVEQGVITNARTRIWFNKEGLASELCTDGALTGGLSGEQPVALSGAEFTLYEDEDCNKEIMTVKSGENGVVEFEKQPKAASYYIKETKALDGYIKDDMVYEAVLDGTGAYMGLYADGRRIENLELVNDQPRTDIILTKVSEQDPDKKLPGSTYGLFKKAKKAKSAGLAMLSINMPVLQADEEWSLIAKAVTDEAGKIVFKGVLPNTEYLVREMEAPEGSHVSDQPVTLKFTLNESGKVVLKEFTDGSGTADVDPVTGEILWREPPIMLGFEKQDEEGNALPGAALVLKNSEGEVVDRWVSSKEMHKLVGDKMEGMILAGHEYQLIEEKAPEGYQLAEPITFTVETRNVGPNEEFVQKIFTVDKKEVKADGKPTVPDQKDPNQKDPNLTVPEQITETIVKNILKLVTPKTGDRNNLLPYVFGMMGAAAFILWYLIRRKGFGKK